MYSNEVMTILNYKIYKKLISVGVERRKFYFIKLTECNDIIKDKTEIEFE